MTGTSIQKADIQDFDILLSLGIETFSETFSAHNTAENMKKYISESFAPQKLSWEINEPGAVFFLLRLDEKPIGYLKLNFGNAQTELKDPEAMEIERIYVLKEFHGKKFGKQLLEKAIQLATERGLKYVWLGVWEENKRAINFYLKHNFTRFDQHFFTVGDDIQTDIMMRLTI